MDIKPTAPPLTVSPEEHRNDRERVATINRLWRERGFDVNARLKKPNLSDDNSRSYIASDLVGGLPPGWPGRGRKS